MSKKTTFTDPRLAFAVEEKDDNGHMRQQFDSNSTALQVSTSPVSFVPHVPKLGPTW